MPTLAQGLFSRVRCVEEALTSGPVTYETVSGDMDRDEEVSDGF